MNKDLVHVWKDMAVDRILNQTSVTTRPLLPKVKKPEPIKAHLMHDFGCPKATCKLPEIDDSQELREPLSARKIVFTKHNDSFLNRVK